MIDNSVIFLPKQLQNKITIVTISHTKKTGHTKFTILGISKNKEKRQLNWQVIKCKECGSSIS